MARCKFQTFARTMALGMFTALLLSGCAKVDGTVESGMSGQPSLPESQDSAATATGDKASSIKEQPVSGHPDESTKHYATFGAGCFWCVEAVFQQVEGVLLVESGYEGGEIPNPTYEQVCSGTTGHAEVCRLTYDPRKVDFKTLLEVFWKTHDPTTLNRQGNDVGTQYRSVIFYHDHQQQELAEKYLKELDASGAFDSPIVTQISPAAEFYKAEGYHQNYYNDNPSQPYCQFVVRPKVEKFQKVFGNRLSKKSSPAE